MGRRKPRAKAQPQKTSTSTKAAAPAVELNIGTMDVVDLPLHITVKDVKKKVIKEYDTDLMLVKLICERMVSQHKLQVDADDCFIATPEFLVGLAKGLASIGLIGISPNSSYQVWVIATEMMALLKKSMNEQLKSLSGTG